MQAKPQPNSYTATKTPYELSINLKCNTTAGILKYFVILKFDTTDFIINVASVYCTPNNFLLFWTLAKTNKF